MGEQSYLRVGYNLRCLELASKLNLLHERSRSTGLLNVENNVNEVVVTFVNRFVRRMMKMI